jgi:LmbE family N-acetylglucosaminyl deacetylase
MGSRVMSGPRTLDDVAELSESQRALAHLREFRLRGPVVVVEPHSDDACYSISATLTGGLVRATQLVTLFTHTNWRNGARHDATETVPMRSKESLRFAATIGATHHAGGLSDAGMRSPATHDPMQPVGDEAELTGAAVDILERTVGAAGCLLVPLGVGGHPDHTVTRHACNTYASTHNIPVIYYEELPYCIITNGWVESLCVGLHPHIIDTGTSIKAKRRMMKRYRSQVDRWTLGTASFRSGLLEQGPPQGKAYEQLWFPGSTCTD